MRFRLVLPLLALSWRLFAQGSGAEGDGGDYLWRRALGGAVLGQPAIEAGSLVAVTDGGSLSAHSLGGEALWTFSARGRLNPYLTRSPEGTSYVGRSGGILIAVNGSGRELWRASLGAELSGPVVLGRGGRVFAPTAASVAAFTASGTPLWRRDFAHRISSGPWPEESGGLLLGLENGDVFRICPFGETSGWRFSAAPSFLVCVRRTASPNPSPEGPAILALHHTGDVWAIDPSNPEAAPESLPRLPAAPVAAAGRGPRAVVVLSNGRVLMLSARGEVLWTADSHAGTGSQRGGVSVVYDGRGVYVLSQNGASGFSGDGRPLWRTSLRNASGLPAIGHGTLFSGGTDWILYAWRLDDAAAAQGRAPQAGGASSGDPPRPPSAFSATPMSRNEAMIARELDVIQRGIQAGNVGRNEQEWIAFLKETAEGGTWPGASSMATRPGVPVTHRIRALQLLARIGSGEDVPWLVTLFRRERYPTVMAAAALAIGSIGFDPEGRAMAEFAALASPGNSFRNEHVLVSIAAAAGALCRFSGAPAYEAGVRVLLMLSSVNQPPSVQRQARHELETLRS